MTSPDRALSNSSSASFPIVGIGASAGGLQALRDFFTHMPPDKGMAFVVIMHLSPNHESQAAEVLQNTTAMPVTQVTKAVKVQPNHVYVIPPSKNLQLSEGQIIPTEMEPLHAGKQVAIDLFFRTLAETHKENAIGIVLSGMGADGTNGLKRIKEQNGFSFAQEPREAEHDSMPMHAIHSQLVDFVLPVALMPAKLIELSKNATRIKLPPETEPAVLSQADQDEAALREILALLRTNSGHDFTHYRRVTVLRRISRRLQVHQLQHLAGYRDFLREHPEEAKALLKDLLISVTNFFRDHQAFAEFERVAVPAIFAGKGATDQVRVWVAGCATGEETYSVAMLLLEYAAKLPRPPTIQIFATDIDEGAIKIARDGFYTETIQADVAPERLNRFFTKESGGYRIRKELRDCVLFAVHNILKDPPFLRLDAITCRNLLIYLNRDAQRHLFELFHFVLVPGGWLLLGNSESLDTKTELFTTFDKRYRIYRTKNGKRDRLPIQNFRFAITQPQNSLAQAKGVIEPLRVPLADFHRRVLDQHSAASVIVDNSYEILHLSDHAGRFLRFGSGEPSHNLLKVIYPELRIELRRVLLQAGQQGKSIESARIKIERPEGLRYVRITARPVKNEDEEANNYILVLFDAVEEISSEANALSQTATGPLVGLLEDELQKTKDHQRATIEQYETQAEELRASNEELQAINEELRSATEELETGKEELQSVNEEIQTVNAELKQKIDELAITNSDLQNLIISTDLATIFVDRNLSIKFYTPRAREIFNLIQFDVGRSLADITHKLDYEGMLADVERVLDESSKAEREVRSSDGRWYVAQLIPYKLLGDRTDGVILTFTDFTKRKLAEDEALSARTKLEQQALDLKETNAELEMEVSERQRVELERGKLLRRLVLAQEEERSRIAREMHDQFGQLTVLSLKLEALKKDCADNTHLCEQVEMAQAIAQQLDAEVDNLIWEMRPTALDDLGLEEALKSYIQRWSVHLGIQVEFHATAIDPDRLTLEIETVLYRIAQEALNNVAKHAQASTVAIVLERRRGQVSLIIEDDGVGFDFQEVRGESDIGLGLIGMRERATLLGGTIEIETQPTRGTTVVVRIPLRPLRDTEAIDE
jgi:two-component system CheB/CheR fusion protein